MLGFSKIGAALRWLRARRGLSQAEAASYAGITPPMLSAYETGQQSPSLITVDKILQALGYDIRHLSRALQRAEGGSEWTEEMEAAPFTGFEAAVESPLRSQIHGLLDEEEKRLGSLTHRERMILDHILFGVALSGRYVRGGSPVPAAPDAGGGPEEPGPGVKGKKGK